MISGGEEQTLAGCEIQGLEAERLQSGECWMSMTAAEVILEQKEVIASQSYGSQEILVYMVGNSIEKCAGQEAAWIPYLSAILPSHYV